jgi:hypothetical protein
MGMFVCLALWFSNQVNVPTMDVSTFSTFMGQIWETGYWLTYAIAAVSIAATAVLIVWHCLAITQEFSRDTYVKPRDIFWTMLALTAAAYAYGAFANPFASADYPWPFVGHHEWALKPLALGVAIVGCLLLVPAALMLMRLMVELWARVTGRFTSDQMLCDLTASVAEHRGPDFQALKSLLVEIRGSTGQPVNLDSITEEFKQKLDNVVVQAREQMLNATPRQEDEIDRLDRAMKMLDAHGFELTTMEFSELTDQIEKLLKAARPETPSASEPTNFLRPTGVAIAR